MRSHNSRTCLPTPPVQFSLFSLNILTNAKLKTLQIYKINVYVELIWKFEYDGQVNHLVF